MDVIFGKANFQNEVVWKRTSAHSDVTQGAKHCGRIHDVLLFSTKRAGNHCFIPQQTDYEQDDVDASYSFVEYPDGTIYRFKKPKAGILQELGERRKIEDPAFESN